jgi:hypothetical protein
VAANRVGIPVGNDHHQFPDEEHQQIRPSIAVPFDALHRRLFVPPQPGTKIGFYYKVAHLIHEGELHIRRAPLMIEYIPIFDIPFAVVVDGSSNTLNGLKARSQRTPRRHGVDVQVVVDKSQAKAHYTSATFLANVGIPTRIDYRYAIMHNKFMVMMT